jgi:hypothetical protein
MNLQPTNRTIMSNKAWEQQEVVRLLKGAPGTQYQEADDANKAIIRDWVRSLLQKHPVTIVFVKADGSDREMRCTLNGDFIPAAAWPSTSVDGLVKESRSRKQPDEHTLRVFDLELMEWRSFRFERLKKVVAELRFD